MEGRAIARPNRSCDERARMAAAQAFNGGPSNCSAKPPRTCERLPASVVFGLQWRAEQLLGQTGGHASHEVRHSSSISSLQWRAEQLLGQTTAPDVDKPPTDRISLQWRAEQLLGQTALSPHPDTTASHRSFNGGPSNCSAKQVERPPAPRLWMSRCPSMEGRAIARPNVMTSTVLAARRGPDAFNGGPSNCSAKPEDIRTEAPPGQRTLELQWRAEQLLGQTSATTATRLIRPCSRLQWRAEQLLGQTCGLATAFNGGGSLGRASMEGRAIARPNFPLTADSCHGVAVPLQWRAEQLLGQTGRLTRWWGHTVPNVGLQWRAEQLLGQTTPVRPGRRHCGIKTDLQWRAEQLLGQTGSLGRRSTTCSRPSSPSMEGRAIARPNRQAPSDQLSQPLLIPSMEGRAIARPNLDAS